MAKFQHPDNLLDRVWKIESPMSQGTLTDGFGLSRLAA